MKKAFSQNGRRNIAVVVDLLFLNESPMRHYYFGRRTELGLIVALNGQHNGEF